MQDYCAVAVARNVKDQSRATSWLRSSTKRLYVHLAVVVFSPPASTCTALHIYNEVNTLVPIQLLVSSILTSFNFNSMYFDQPEPHPQVFGSAGDLVKLACHWGIEQGF